MKKPQNIPYVRTGVTAFLVLLASLVLFFVLYHLSDVAVMMRLIWHILRPISMGMILAFLLLPIHRGILKYLCDGLSEKHRNSKRVMGTLKGVSILLSLLFAAVIVYVFLDMVFPQVYHSLVGLIQSIPDGLSRAEQWILNFLEDNPDIQAAFLSFYNATAVSFENWLNQEIIPNLNSLTATLQWIKDSLLPNIGGMISNVSSVVVNVLIWLKDALIAVIVSVYLLADKDTFAAHAKKIVYSIFPTRIGDVLVAETRNAYQIMSGFINGKLLDSLIIGILSLICCNVLKFPYPALIALIIGVTNIIPFFGPFIGAIPSAILILLVEPRKFLPFCLFVFVLQQFDGNILGPKILGESTGLSSFWVLFSILLFGGLFGFAGMVLGVPFFAILYSILRRLVNQKLVKRRLPVCTEAYMGYTEQLADQNGSDEA